MSDYTKALKELRESLDTKTVEILNKAVVEGRALSTDEQSNLDNLAAAKVDADKRYQSAVESEQRSTDIEKSFRDVTRRDERKGEGEQSPLDKFLRSARVGDGFDIAPVPGAVKRAQEAHREARAMSGTGGLGKDGVYGQLWEYAVASSQLLDVVDVINTADGNTLPMPVATAHSQTDDTAVDPSGDITESDATITTKDLAVSKYAYITYIPSELFEDATFDLEGYLARSGGRELGRRLGKVAAAAAVAGFTTAGVTTPAGVLTGLGNQATAGQGSDLLIDLYHSVLPEYRADASTAYGMADSSAGIIRKLKGTDGSPVWQPALTAGAPDLLLGKPVKIVPEFDSFAASKKPVFFGDWSALKLRIAGGLRVDRSADIKFANDQIAFRVIVRAGGLGIDANAVKYLATPAE